MAGGSSPIHEACPGQRAQFAAEAREAFGILGCEPVDAGDARLEYRSREAVVVVGLRPARNGAYRSVELAFAPAGESDPNRYLSASHDESLPATSREEMRESLRRLAEPARELLAGPRSRIEALQSESRRRIRENAERIAIEDRRRDAKAAFDAGDYARAVELYEPLADRLGRAERLRLGYARRRAR